MNTVKIRTGLKSYELTDWTAPSGVQTIAAKNGSRVAYIRPEADGRIYVTCFIDYGVDGRNWCDSGTYKTETGAIRKAAGFLR